MKELIERLHPAFDNRYRAGVMTLLTGEERLEFNALLHLLDMTKGNLATHLKALEQQGMIAVYKDFVERKSRTTYSATPEGLEAWRRHLDALTELLQAAEAGFDLEDS